MRNCFSTSQASSRTTPWHPSLWPISHLIPWGLVHPSHLKSHHRGILQFQFLPTLTLQVTYPWIFHLRFLQIYHLIILYQIHLLLPVNIKVLSTPALLSHPQGFHLLDPHNSHLIRLALIICCPQYYFYLQIGVRYPVLHHQTCLFYCHNFFSSTRTLTLYWSYTLKGTNSSNSTVYTW